MPGSEVVGRKINKAQGVYIKSYRIMGASLNTQLAEAPELREEISELLHQHSPGRGKIYEIVLRSYFLESGRDLQTLARSPFVQAFQNTPLCADEETVFLNVFSLTANTPEISEGTTSDFRQWVRRRIPIMAKGLQSYVLGYESIPSLSDEERAKRTGEIVRERMAADPEGFVAMQRQLSEAAAAAAEPKVYTDEVRIKMQEWFDRGLDYQTVVELLKGLGIETNYKTLRKTVGYYPDLHYTPAEIELQRREGLKKAAGVIFRLSGSRMKTIEILDMLGYSHSRTASVLHNLGLRNKVYWDERVEIAGTSKRLDELVLDFATGNYLSIPDEYRAFVAFLIQHNIEIKFSQASYQGARRKILQQDRVK